MLVEAEVTIDGAKAEVWAAAADIEHAAQIIKGIVKIEVVARPAQGLVGLKWRETRILFDEPATVEKWITAAVEGESYETRAESHGFVFLTTLRLAGQDGSVTVTSAHDSQPQGLVARLKTIPMALFFKGVIRKHILQDLNDLKTAVEKRT
jgi:Polyketide cyclase / dehydrase and lipid transport